MSRGIVKCLGRDDLDRPLDPHGDSGLGFDLGGRRFAGRCCGDRGLGRGIDVRLSRRLAANQKMQAYQRH